MASFYDNYSADDMFIFHTEDDLKREKEQVCTLRKGYITCRVLINGKRVKISLPKSCFFDVFNPIYGAIADKSNRRAAAF